MPPNPYGLLTIVYAWGTKDLDTLTSFLSGQVGFGYSGGSYMTFSGDDVGTEVRETVTIDLAAAYANEEIAGQATILMHADWFPTRPNPDAPPEFDAGTGPAVVGILYEIGDDQIFDEDHDIPEPGGFADVMPSATQGTGATPASTYVGMITIYDDGTYSIIMV